MAHTPRPEETAAKRLLATFLEEGPQAVFDEVMALPEDKREALFRHYSERFGYPDALAETVESDPPPARNSPRHTRGEWDVIRRERNEELRATGGSHARR